MGHLHPGQIPPLIKDSRLAPSSGLDLNGAMVADPGCRPPNMADVFPSGMSLSLSLSLTHTHTHAHTVAFIWLNLLQLIY